MKTSLIYLVLLAGACLPVLCGEEKQPTLQPEAHTESRSPFAALDEVRVLANGLLQLGQSLRNFVRKTKGQISEIFQKLNIFDDSFNKLSVLAGKIKVEEEELKKTAVVLKANNEEIKGISVQINSKVDIIMQEKNFLQSKVEDLEEKLRSLSQGMLSGDQVLEINSLRGVINSQEQSITELLKAVREQSDQLNYQRNKIKSLEEKLTVSAFAQDTVERKLESFNSETPTLSPYLGSASSNKTAAMDLPVDCSELFNRGEKSSGVYPVRPNGSEPFMVFCDMSAAHGATVIQRRKDGSVNFDQTWENYENGFGDFHGEFWLGLSKIHSLVAQGNSVLHIHLEDWKQSKRFIEYTFDLDGPESNYTLHLKLLSGDLVDPLENQTGVMFSTKDRDNDKKWDSSCAHTGGWWFSSCGDTNLNGRYFLMRHKGRLDRRRGIHLKPGRKTSFFLRFTQISVHPYNLSSTSSETDGFHTNSADSE
nr:angiopoietin-related protein 3-like [Nerophis lumbriciformis]